MTKTAFLFPGQGSQKVGMGAAVLESEPDVFEHYLGLASEASALDIRRLCLEGPIEDLTATEAAQPALFAVSLAVLELARRRGLEPDFVAGHSLGEYTAAVAAGAVSAEAGIQLVAHRGRLMANIQSERPGAMAAIIGLDSERVDALCVEASAHGIVAAANHNTPTQIVCSGEDKAVAALIELAREAGADRAVALKVGAAFHSELMKPIQQDMARAMASVTWRDPATPLVGNATGTVKRTASEVREALIQQIASPVLWVDCVQTLTGAGCQTFLELGPGRTLIGLIRKISADVETFAADSSQRLDEFVAARAA